MDAPESGTIWTSVAALIGGGGGFTALWKGIYNLKARLTVVEGTTDDHDKKLDRGAKKIGDTHTAVQVLTEKTLGLETKIDDIGKDQKTMLKHLLSAKTGAGG
jgi:hypothetical protein